MGKQAVLLIHGVGEQRPMDTLRGFVDEVWTKNTGVHREHGPDAAGLWSKPYPLSTDFELRKLTTASNKEGVRTDFFEFYWAHLMNGTTLGHVGRWMRKLLLRSPATVPVGLRGAYWVLWGLLGAGALALVVFWIKYQRAPTLLDMEPSGIAALLSLVIFPFAGWLTTRVVGDAARYLDVAPDNVQTRHAIRSAGLDVLRKLHAQDYDRIVIVGHSLGSVIGYDILGAAWSELSAVSQGAAQTVTAPKLERVRALASAEIKVDDFVTAYQAAQRDALREWTASGQKWRVTDFVTLGSPLAHATALLAADASQLHRKFDQREFLTCPPTLEPVTAGSPPSTFLYRHPGAGLWPHHAAAFAFTRWTNLFFPCSWIVHGDMIGGRMAPVFGAGIRDISVSTSRWGGFFSHTAYWNPARPSDTHIDCMLAAIDLLDIAAQPGL